MASDVSGMTIDRLTADRTSYLYGPNGAYIAELYDQYLADPSSVDDSWATLFADLRGDADAILEEVDGPDGALRRSRPEQTAKRMARAAKQTVLQAPALMPRPSVPPLWIPFVR